MERRIALVYQGGMANVFDVTRAGDVPELPPFGRLPSAVRHRLLQHAFAPCEWFAAGLVAAGVSVSVYHCDQAGDVVGLTWSPGPGDLFADVKRPPTQI